MAVSGDPVFCHRYPTGTCVGSNTRVRSYPGILRETWEPRSPPAGSGSDAVARGWAEALAKWIAGTQAARRADGAAGERGRKKRRPACNGSDTGCDIPRPEREPTSAWCSVAREQGEPPEGGEQKTAKAAAPSDGSEAWKWIDGSAAKETVRKLQVRIAKAAQVEDGFDFLGQTLRKKGRKLLIRPAREAVRAIRRTLAQTLRRGRGGAASATVQILNAQIRGWAHYHRHVAAADTFVALDKWLFRTLRKWTKRRHPGKGPRWLRQTYWTLGDRGWLAVLVKTKRGHRLHRLLRTTSVSIVRHIKVLGEATPYDPACDEYFKGRKAGKKHYPARGSQAELRALTAAV